MSKKGITMGFFVVSFLLLFLTNCSNATSLSDFFDILEKSVNPKIALNKLEKLNNENSKKIVEEIDALNESEIIKKRDDILYFFNPIKTDFSLLNRNYNYQLSPDAQTVFEKILVKLNKKITPEKAGVFNKDMLRDAGIIRKIMKAHDIFHGREPSKDPLIYTPLTPWEFIAPIASGIFIKTNTAFLDDTYLTTMIEDLNKIEKPINLAIQNIKDEIGPYDKISENWGTLVEKAYQNLWEKMEKITPQSNASTIIELYEDISSAPAQAMYKNNALLIDRFNELFLMLTRKDFLMQNIGIFVDEALKKGINLDNTHNLAKKYNFISTINAIDKQKNVIININQTMYQLGQALSSL